MGNKNAGNTIEINNLQKITGAILITGILVVSGAIIYTVLQLEEEYALFFILNEDQTLGNYPTNATVGESVEFHLLVENHFTIEKDFLIKLYKGNNQTQISMTTGCNITSIQEIPITLSDGEVWISPILSISFEDIGDNQLIIAELWEKNGQTHVFIANLILILRIEVLPS